MLSYRFPPAPGVGGLRAFHFARHLPEFGWSPIVLTSRPVPGEPVDEALARTLSPAVRVVRTRPVARRSRLERAYQEAAVPRRGPSALLRGLRSVLAPDGYILWWPAAVTTAIRLHRRTGFDAVFATAPPFSALVIGRHVKRLTGRPLVSDVRDPWTQQFEDVRRSETPRRQERERDMERRVLEASDRVLVTSPELEAHLLGEHPLLGGKLATIPNGYDADDEAVPPRSFDRFAVVYTGRLTAGYDIAPLLRAVERFPGRSGIEIHLVGEADADIRDAVRDSPVSSLVTLHGLLPHREAVAFQRGADLLVASLAPDWPRMTIAAKLFEYLHAGRPVLAIMDPACSSARLVERTGMGRVVAPEDVDGIARVLRDALARPAGERAERRAPPPEYDRRTLTAALAQRLDEAVARSS